MTARKKNSTDDKNLKQTENDLIFAVKIVSVSLVIASTAFIIGYYHENLKKCNNFVAEKLKAEQLATEKITSLSEAIKNATIKNIKIENNVTEVKQLKYWGICLEHWNEAGSLRSMNRVFEKLNFKFVDNHEYDIVWSIEGTLDSPFSQVKEYKKTQKINHIPGIPALVTKSYMTYYNYDSKFILPAFRLPYDKKNFIDYAKKYPNEKFVRKNIFNRGVEIVNVTDIIDDQDRDVFYQEFLSNVS